MAGKNPIGVATSVVGVPFYSAKSRKDRSLVDPTYRGGPRWKGILQKSRYRLESASKSIAKEFSKDFVCYLMESRSSKN